MANVKLTNITQFTSSTLESNSNSLISMVANVGGLPNAESGTISIANLKSYFENNFYNLDVNNDILVDQVYAREYYIGTGDSIPGQIFKFIPNTTTPTTTLIWNNPVASTNSYIIDTSNTSIATLTTSNANVNVTVGSGAIFTILANSESNANIYSITQVNSFGSEYNSGDNIQIKGSALGGVDSVNDLTIVVDYVQGSRPISIEFENVTTLVQQLYANSNLAELTTEIVSNSDIITTANITSFNIIATSNAVITGNISGNIVETTGNVSGNNIIASTDVIATGNVSGAYFKGNGTELSLDGITSNISSFANITANNISITSLLQLPAIDNATRNTLDASVGQVVYSTDDDKIQVFLANLTWGNLALV